MLARERVIMLEGADRLNRTLKTVIICLILGGLLLLVIVIAIQQIFAPRVFRIENCWQQDGGQA